MQKDKFQDSPEQNLWGKAWDLYSSAPNEQISQIWENNRILNAVGENAARNSVATELLERCWKIIDCLENVDSDTHIPIQQTVQPEISKIICVRCFVIGRRKYKVTLLSVPSSSSWSSSSGPSSLLSLQMHTDFN